MRVQHILTFLFVAATMGVQAHPAKLRRALSSPQKGTIVGYQIGKQGANHRDWLKVVQTTDAKGHTTLHTNLACVQLATGINYKDPTTGRWSPSKEEIDSYPGGAIAQYGQQKVVFADNLNTAGAIDLQMPNGKEMKSDVLGLGYYDAASGKSVLIAEVQNSQGQIVGSNGVLYPDAFKGVNASVLYKYTLAGLEQNVVLSEQPPPPESFGLSSTSCVLQVLTEFTAAPTPTINGLTNVMTESGPLSDEQLDFGAMKMVPGKAFLLGSNSLSASVCKQWLNVNGRTVLVESVPLATIASSLSYLPVFARTGLKPSISPPQYAASTERLLPPPRTAAKTRAEMELASSGSPKYGLVMDYVEVLTGNGFLQGDTTYFVSAPVYCNNLTIEGGTVVKFPHSTSSQSFYIQVSGTLTCDTGPYNPAIFTAGDDNSVGDSLAGTGLMSDYTGTISSYYANPALSFVSTPAQVLSNFRIAYAWQAVSIPNCNNPTFYNGQIVNCQNGFDLNYGQAYLRNILFAGVLTNFNNLFDVSVFVQCATCCSNELASAMSPNSATVNMTDCVLARVATDAANATGVSLVASYNGFYPPYWAFGNNTFGTSKYPFQIAAGGDYYLTNGCGFQGVGTANIDPTLLADLKTKTTHPPVALPSLMLVSGDLTLSPQIARDTGANPDLGYHYDPLDYTVAQMVLEGGSLTVLPGTTIGVRNDYIASQNGWTTAGIIAEEGSSVTAHGFPAVPITFTSTKMVQEQPETSFAQYQMANSIPFSAVSFLPYFEPNATGLPAPTFDFRFCDFSLPESDYHIWGGYSEDGSGYFSPDSAVYLGMRDCNLYSGRMDLGKTFDESTVFGPGAVSLVNNLFDRVSVNLDPDWFDKPDSTIYVNLALQAYNNLFRGGTWLHLDPVPAAAGNNWVFENNLFDQVDFYQNASEPLDYDYNAYWPLATLNGNGDASELAPTTTGDGFTDGTAGNHEVILSSAPPYQAGPLGNYYMETGTPLASAGAFSPGDSRVGLSQYTTRTDQTKELGQSQVDIGLHYVATTGSTSTTPMDYDGDGVCDYIEDANGNGQYDAGTETDWQHADSTTDPNTGQPVADASSTIYDDVDLSGDGIVGRIKKALGIDPLDPSNPLTLTQIITGEEPQFATFEVPVNYATLMSIGGLELLVDGVAAQYQECNQAADGNCLLKWNTAFESPGQNELAAEVELNGEFAPTSTPDPTVLNGAGPTASFNSDDVCKFDPAFSTFNSSATLYATLPQQNATYTIELEDPSGNPITTLTGSTTTGVIDVPWNLTYADGTTYFGNSVKAIFNVTLADPTSGSLDFWVYRATTGIDGDFTAAFAWDIADQTTPQSGSMWVCIEYNVVDQLLEPCNVNWCYNHPYNSMFNVAAFYPYTGGQPGLLQSQTDVNNLLSNLGNLATMNFYFDGHGSERSIGNDESGASSVEVGLGDILSHTLDTGGVEGPNWQHPYRFVFLNACDTANRTWYSQAFGIPPRITTGELATGHEPQAFVGWAGKPRSAITDSDWNNLAQTYAVFWGAWMSEQYTLQDCLYMASQEYPYAPDDSVQLEFPLGLKFNVLQNYWGLRGWNNFHLRIYGYAGIMRIGYNSNSSFDSSPYYQ